MIQFNLLPDVKIEYIKAQYRKRLAITISVVVSAVFLGLLILLLLFVKVGQTRHMDALTNDIQAGTNKLKENQDIDKILTIQNQLNSLPRLHNDKLISSRLFDYLVQLTPNQATISDVTLDLEANTLSIKGNADSLSNVNKFADTLKFTNYKVGGTSPKEGKAFSGVVLTNFTVGSETNSTQPSKQVSYEINLSFDPVIFANSMQEDGKPAEVSLIVPKIISTRSELGKPDDVLFDSQPQDKEGGAR